jgi:uncharacterized protein YjdB
MPEEDAKKLIYGEDRNWQEPNPETDIINQAEEFRKGMELMEQLHTPSIFPEESAQQKGAALVLDKNKFIKRFFFGAALLSVAILVVLMQGFFVGNEQIFIAEEVVLAVDKLTLEVESSYKLQASVKPHNTADKTIRWFSSDDSVVTVDENGKIQAVDIGVSAIIAICDDASARCEITVEPKLIEAGEVTLQQNEHIIQVGDSIGLEATVSPDDTTDKTIQWQSSDPSVVAVDNSGIVTGVAAGWATVTAACGDAIATGSISVIEGGSGTALPPSAANLNKPAQNRPAQNRPAQDREPVPEPTPEPEPEPEPTSVFVSGIAISKATMIMEAGQRTKLTTTVTPENATDKTLHWSSSDSSIITVDSSGNVTAVGKGTAVITVRCGNYSVTCTITVG